MTKNILIATPHNEFGELLHLTLEENSDYNIMLVTSGKGMMETANKVQFDLVIVDTAINDKPFIPLVQNFQDENPKACLVIVMPQNEANQPDLSEIRVDGFLSRPCYPSDLLKMVEDLIGKPGAYTKPEALKPTVEAKPVMSEADLMKNFASLTIQDTLEEEEEPVNTAPVSVPEPVEEVVITQPVAAVEESQAVEADVAPPEEIVPPVEEITQPINGPDLEPEIPVEMASEADTAPDTDLLVAEAAASKVDTSIDEDDFARELAALTSQMDQSEEPAAPAVVEAVSEDVPLPVDVQVEETTVPQVESTPEEGTVEVSPLETPVVEAAAENPPAVIPSSEEITAPEVPVKTLPGELPGDEETPPVITDEIPAGEANLTPPADEKDLLAQLEEILAIGDNTPDSVPENIADEENPAVSFSEVLAEEENSSAQVSEIPTEDENAAVPFIDIPAEEENTVVPFTEIPSEEESTVVPFTEIPAEEGSTVVPYPEIPVEEENTASPTSEMQAGEDYPPTPIAEIHETEENPQEPLVPEAEIPVDIEPEVKEAIQAIEKEITELEVELDTTGEIKEEIKAAPKPAIDFSRTSRGDQELAVKHSELAFRYAALADEYRGLAEEHTQIAEDHARLAARKTSLTRQKAETVDKIGQVIGFLNKSLAESGAQGILVVKGTNILGFSGDLAEQAFLELASFLERDFSKDGKADLVRFVHLESSNIEYLVYSTVIKGEVILGMAYDTAVPLSKMRIASGLVAKNLGQEQRIELLEDLSKRQEDGALPVEISKPIEIDYQGESIEDMLSQSMPDNMGEFLSGVSSPNPPSIVYGNPQEETDAQSSIDAILQGVFSQLESNSQPEGSSRAENLASFFEVDEEQPDNINDFTPPAENSLTSSQYGTGTQELPQGDVPWFDRPPTPSAPPEYELSLEDELNKLLEEEEAIYKNKKGTAAAAVDKPGNRQDALRADIPETPILESVLIQNETLETEQDSPEAILQRVMEQLERQSVKSKEEPLEEPQDESLEEPPLVSLEALEAAEARIHPVQVSDPEEDDILLRVKEQLKRQAVPAEEEFATDDQLPGWYQEIPVSQANPLEIPDEASAVIELPESITSWEDQAQAAVEPPEPGLMVLFAEAEDQAASDDYDDPIGEMPEIPRMDISPASTESDPYSFKTVFDHLLKPGLPVIEEIVPTGIPSASSPVPENQAPAEADEMHGSELNPQTPLLAIETPVPELDAQELPEAVEAPIVEVNQQPGAVATEGPVSEYENQAPMETIEAPESSLDAQGLPEDVESPASGLAGDGPMQAAEPRASEIETPVLPENAGADTPGLARLDTLESFENSLPDLDAVPPAQAIETPAPEINVPLQQDSIESPAAEISPLTLAETSGINSAEIDQQDIPTDIEALMDVGPQSFPEVSNAPSFEINQQDIPADIEVPASEVDQQALPGESGDNFLEINQQAPSEGVEPPDADLDIQAFIAQIEAAVSNLNPPGLPETSESAATDLEIESGTETVDTPAAQPDSQISSILVEALTTDSVVQEFPEQPVEPPASSGEEEPSREEEEIEHPSPTHEIASPALDLDQDIEETALPEAGLQTSLEQTVNDSPPADVVSIPGPVQEESVSPIFSSDPFPEQAQDLESNLLEQDNTSAEIPVPSVEKSADSMTEPEINESQDNMVVPVEDLQPAVLEAAQEPAKSIEEPVQPGDDDLEAETLLDRDFVFPWEEKLVKPAASPVDIPTQPVKIRNSDQDNSLKTAAENAAVSPTPVRVGDTQPVRLYKKFEEPMAVAGSEEKQSLPALDQTGVERDTPDLKPNSPWNVFHPNQSQPPLRRPNQQSYTCILVPRQEDYPINEEIGDDLGDALPELCEKLGWQLDKLQINPDYLQWTVEVLTTVSPGNLIRIVRQRTSKTIFSKYPKIKEALAAEDFWAPGYLVVSGSEPPPPSSLNEFIQQTRRRQKLLKTLTS